MNLFKTNRLSYLFSLFLYLRGHACVNVCTCVYGYAHVCVWCGYSSIYMYTWALSMYIWLELFEGKLQTLMYFIPKYFSINLLRLRIVASTAIITLRKCKIYNYTVF